MYRSIINKNSIFLLNIIAREKSLNVSKLTELSMMEQPVISQYLGILRKVNLINCEVKSKYKFYSIIESNSNIIIDFTNKLIQGLNVQTNNINSISLIDNYKNFVICFNVFKVLNNANRYKIIERLLVDNSLSVIELVEKLDIKQSIVSQNLKILKNSNLVHRDKKGKYAIYSITSTLKNVINITSGNFILE